MTTEMLDYLSGYFAMFIIMGTVIFGLGVGVGVGISYKLWSDITKGPKPYTRLVEIDSKNK